MPAATSWQSGPSNTTLQQLLWRCFYRDRAGLGIGWGTISAIYAAAEKNRFQHFFTGKERNQARKRYSRHGSHAR